MKSPMATTSDLFSQTEQSHLNRLSFCSQDAKENANSVTLKESLQITGSLTSKINVSLREGKQIPSMP